VVDYFRRNSPIFAGCILTLIWLAGVGLFLSTSHSIEEIKTMKLNEFGDFLAGFSAPLAFLWLIVAVFMQRQELQLQRLELEHSRDVLKVQLEELRASAEKLDAQTNLIASQNETLQATNEFSRWENQVVVTIKEMNRLAEGRGQITASYQGSTRIVPFSTIFVDLEDIGVNLPDAIKRAAKSLQYNSEMYRDADNATLQSPVDKSGVLELARTVNSLLDLLDPTGSAAKASPHILEWQLRNPPGEFVSLSRDHMSFLLKVSN
jgi:hypothetical protein